MTKKQKYPASFGPTPIPMKLSPEDAARIGRILKPRDTVMSVRVAESDLAAWKKAADAEGVYFVDWVEEACADKHRRVKK